VRRTASEAGRSTPPPGDPGPAPTVRSIWIDLLLYPTHSLPTAAAPVLVGLGLAAHDGVLAPLPALVALAGSWVIHVAGVFADNHELLRLHPHVPEHPELNRAIADGTLRLSTLRAAIAGCLVLAAATAPYLHAIGGAPVLALGALGIAVSLSYNAGPLAYVRRGLAEPIFLLMFGVVAVAGTYFIQAAAVRGAPDPWALLAALPLPVWLAGLPCGALVTGVMVIDDLRDHVFDREKGWRTFAVRRGPAGSRAVLTALVTLATLAPLGLWASSGFDAWVLLPLVTAPIAWRTVRAVRAVEAWGDRARLVPLTPRLARLALLHSALLGLGLALSR
jgi:1,4-dihydroxy-2-naphthoate octaprenyltransferase